MSTSPAAQQHAATGPRPAAAAHWLAKLALSCFTGGRASEPQQPEQSQKPHDADCSSALPVCHGRATNSGRATGSGQQQQQQQRHSVQANGRTTPDFSYKVNIASPSRGNLGAWDKVLCCRHSPGSRGRTAARCAAPHAKYHALAALLHARARHFLPYVSVCMSHLQDVAPTTRLAGTALRSEAQ